MQVVAARYEIYQKTESSLSLGWVGLALALPMLVLTLPAGHLADLRSRRRLMMSTMLICAVSCVGMAWLSQYRQSWHYSIPAMYILLGLGAVGGTLGRPARAALMPQLVSSEVFPNAVAWNASFYETASVIGPGIGGFVCARSIALAYLLSTVFFVLCSILIWKLPEQHVPPKRSGKSDIAELMAGLKFVWRTKILLGAMTMDLLAVLLGGATYLLPVFAEKILHVGATGFGWLNAAPSIGAISMAMIQAHRRPIQRSGVTLLWCVAGFGVTWIVFGLSRNYWLSFAMLVLSGAFDNISVVVRHSLTQMLTPDSMRGRVSAVNQIFIGSSNELGGLESGLTAYAFGAVPSVVVGGVGTVVIVAFSAVAFPEVKRLGPLNELKAETGKVELVQ